MTADRDAITPPSSDSGTTPAGAPEPRGRCVRIGDIEVWPPVVLAPMAGVTDAAFRSVCRSFGAGLYVGQMVAARPLADANARTLRMCDSAADEHPRSQQLCGTDPATVAAAVGRLVQEVGVDHVDLNFGCPAKKVMKAGGGAALPYKVGLYRSIVRAAVSAAEGRPVTVKFRLGIDDSTPTYLDAGRIAQDEGCAAVALHARTAAQLYSGQADWAAIARLKEAVTEIPVLGNGDIWNAQGALDMVARTGCDGVVIGRACLGRPWLFAELAAAFDGLPAPAPPTFAEVRRTALRHAALMAHHQGEGPAMRAFRKHAVWYSKGFSVPVAVRRRLQAFDTLAQIEDLLNAVDGDQRFPPGAERISRSHGGPPRAVSLPPGWLDDRDDLPLLDVAAGAAASGG